MKPIALLLTVALSVVPAACGSEDDSGSSDVARAIDGHEFWSTRVTEGDVDRTLVEGTRIVVRFDDGVRIGASAGCNSIGGSYTLDGSTLVVSDLAMTEMGCDPARHDQDDFVARLIGGSPTLAVSGDELTVTTAGAAVTFVDASVANPDLELIGTRWVATGFIDGEVAMSFGVARPGELTVIDQSTMTGFDGCTDFDAPIEVSDGSTGGPVEGDGELQFGGVQLTRPAPTCSDAEYAETFQRMFETGDAVYEIDGRQLTVLNRNGVGTTFTAAEA